MKTADVIKELGVSRQWLHLAIQIMDLQPKQVVVAGRVYNDFSKDQVEQLRKVRDKKKRQIESRPRKKKEAPNGTGQAKPQDN
jgi:hypothetical protein